jgi:hypothetical protein
VKAQPGPAWAADRPLRYHLAPACQHLRGYEVASGAAHSRAGIADALATITPALTHDGARRPPAALLRAALYGWAFHPGRADSQPPGIIADALVCAQHHSLPLASLADRHVTRRELGALTLRMDGTRAAVTTTRRKRAVCSKRAQLRRRDRPAARQPAQPAQLAPYLTELGKRWERGTVSIAQEHAASNVMADRLSRDEHPGRGHNVNGRGEAPGPRRPRRHHARQPRAPRCAAHRARPARSALAGAGATPQIATAAGARLLTGDPVTEAENIEWPR